MGGRLKSDFQYGIGTVYNTFPCPPGGLDALDSLQGKAQAVLDARAAHPGSTLADLYDPDLMPGDLRKAHRALDLAVERLYTKAVLSSDRERAEFLLDLYEKAVVQPVLGETPKKVRRRK